MSEGGETHQCTGAIVPEADLHCHILPAWDDGAQTLEEALEMARRAQGTGIQRIVVTPHVSYMFSANPYERARGIPAAVAELQSEARAAGLEVEFVPAAELTLSPELAERVPVEPWLTVGGGGRYVLVECVQPGHWSGYADQVLFQLSLRGITSIICHPERLPEVQRDVGVLEERVKRGAIAQVIAGSLAKDSDRRTRQCARRLLEAGLVSLVSSDAHSEHDALPGEVECVVRSLVGESRALRILVDNPRLVLAGAEVRDSGPQRQDK